MNSLVEYHETRGEKIPALEQKIADVEQHDRQLATRTPPHRSEGGQEGGQATATSRRTIGRTARPNWLSCETKVAAVENDPQLSKLAAAHADIGQQVLAGNGPAARRRSDECRAVAAVLAGLPGRDRSDLPAAGRHVRPHARRKFLSGSAARRREGSGRQGLARESDGAICVFLDGYDVPMIVQKQDGAFLYATTDLATIQYRMSEWRPDAILYVVDHRQSLHFEQLFAAARLWGYRDVELQHIAFGTVLGDDGRPFKTRIAAHRSAWPACSTKRSSGPTRSSRRTTTPGPSRCSREEERRQVAERIGIGAIKYADLAHNRTSDYVFSYDKMLAMTGNTAAYMQYSYARVKSIFAKAGVEQSALRSSQSAIPIRLETPQERALAIALLQFAEGLDRVVTDYRPNHLTAYLFELASRYSDFFENCPVLKAETDELRTSRLLLCDLTARTLKRGLNLLGIEVVERM